MISMTKHQKEEFSRIRQLLNDAESVEEAEHYSRKLQALIKKAKEQNPTATSNFTIEQLRLYKQYREKLQKAKYPRKVRYYQAKIRELLAEIEKTVV